VGEDYYLYYYGSTTTSGKQYIMPDGIEDKVDVLDTWNMAVTEMDSIYSGTFEIKWPSNQYIAVRMYNAENGISEIAPKGNNLNSKHTQNLCVDPIFFK
jgi:hypothetical protein